MQYQYYVVINLLLGPKAPKKMQIPHLASGHDGNIRADACKQELEKSESTSFGLLTPKKASPYLS